MRATPRVRRRDAGGAAGSSERGIGRGPPGVSDAVFPPPVLSRSPHHGVLGIRAVLAPRRGGGGEPDDGESGKNAGGGGTGRPAIPGGGEAKARAVAP